MSLLCSGWSYEQKSEFVDRRKLPYVGAYTGHHRSERRPQRRVVLGQQEIVNRCDALVVLRNARPVEQTFHSPPAYTLATLRAGKAFTLGNDPARAAAYRTFLFHRVLLQCHEHITGSNRSTVLDRHSQD